MASSGAASPAVAVADADPGTAAAAGKLPFDQTAAGKLETAKGLKAKAGALVADGKLKPAARLYKKCLLYTTGIPGLTGGLDEWAKALGHTVPSQEPVEIQLKPALDAFNGVVCTNLAVVYTKLKQLERALKYATMATEHDAANLKARFYMGRIHFRLGNLQRSEQLLQELASDAADVTTEVGVAMVKSVAAELKKIRTRRNAEQRKADSAMASAMKRALGNP